jgi:type II secretory pathway pseudopilin PulG
MNKKVVFGLLAAVAIYLAVKNYKKRKELSALKDAVKNAANSNPTASTGGTVVTPTPPTVTGGSAPEITPNADKVPVVADTLVPTPMLFPPSTGTVAAYDAVIASTTIQKPVLPMVY